MAGCFAAAAAALAILAAPVAAADPVTRQYIGVIGAHDTVELTLTFDGLAVRGEYRMADGGPQGRLEGRCEAGRLELRASAAGGRQSAVMTAPAPSRGVIRGVWQEATSGRLAFYAEEVANDLPAARSLNGHYVRQGKSSGGSLDLLMVDSSQVKAQGHASWIGPGGAAAAGEVAGWAAVEGRSLRLEARPGCVLIITPIDGGLEVAQQGRCPGDFSGRYERRSASVPDWETFRWVGQ